MQPDTLSRRLYDVGALVLRLTSTEEEVHWYHLAYGNLNTSHFTVIELYATSQPSLRSRLAEALGLQVCEVDIDNLSFLNLWQIAKTLDMGQHWKLDLYPLYRSTRFVGDTVRPGLVAIQCLHSQVGVQLWSDSESGRKRKRSCSDALDDGDQFDDDDDDERKSDGEEEWMPLADLGDEGAGGDAGGEGDAEEDNLWEPEDDGGPGDDDDDDGVVDELHRLASGDVEPGPPARPEPPPPRPPLVPPLAAPSVLPLDSEVPLGVAPPAANEDDGDGAVVAGGRRGPLDPNRPGRPLTWQLPGEVGRLKYEPNTKLLAAHCPCGGKDSTHGPVACRLNRSVKTRPGKRGWAGRPLGLLIAWLKAAHECADRQDHLDLTKHSPQAESLSFDNRVLARDWLMNSGMEDLASLLELERDPLPDEGSEPNVSE